MNRIKRCLGVLPLILVLTMAALWAQEDFRLYEKAKVFLFDKKWDQALGELNQLVRQFPKSPYFQLAVFYQSKCHEEKKDYSRALAGYTTFLEISTNQNLQEETHVAIINICYQLFLRGEFRSIDRILTYLDHPQKSVQYYAAFKLSYAGKKEIAKKALPVLKKIISGEKDGELIDRARIALMRIDPEALKDVKPDRQGTAKMIRIVISEKSSQKVKFSLSIPFDLAMLALDAMPPETKDVFKKKGISLESIFQSLRGANSQVKIEEGDAVISITIE